MERSLELKLIKEIQNDENVKANLEALILEHQGIFHRVLNNYLIFDINGMTRNDITNQILTIFWEAAVKFDPDKNVKFVTWLGNYTFFFLSKQYNKLKHSKNSIEYLDGFYETDHDHSKSQNLDTLNFIIDQLDTINDDRIKKVFEIRYFHAQNNKLTPWKIVGEQVGLTGQACINLHNKGLEFIKNQIKNEQQDFFQYAD